MDADASVTPSEAGLGGEGGAPSSGGSAASGDAGATSNAGEGGADNSPHGATIDARGGTVVAPDGAAVIVPEGALTGAVFVEIAQDASGAPSLPAGMPPLGPIYAFTPHGIQFAEPVTVHVPFDPAAVPSGVRPVLLQAEPGGAFAQIPAQLDGSVLSATVSSFSWFVVARVGAIAAGYYHTCALANGGVKCWGDNSVGQLGDGSNTDSTLPIYVQGLPLIDNAVPGVTPTFVHAIATNYDYSCTLLGASYGVMCWGQNTAVTSSKTPITIPGLALAEAITTGVQHACALLPGGTVKCWGDNAYGELGNGSTNGSATPVTVSGLTGAVSISANGNTSCAVLDDGSARCRGAERRRATGGRLTRREWRAIDVSRHGQERGGRGFDLARVEPRLRAADQRHRTLLGTGRCRPARRRIEHELVHAARGLRFEQCHRNLSRARLHVRAALERDRGVLGGRQAALSDPRIERRCDCLRRLRPPVRDAKRRERALLGRKRERPAR